MDRYEGGYDTDIDHLPHSHVIQACPQPKYFCSATFWGQQNWRQRHALPASWLHLCASKVGRGRLFLNRLPYDWGNKHHQFTSYSEGTIPRVQGFLTHSQVDTGKSFQILPRDLLKMMCCGPIGKITILGTYHEWALFCMVLSCQLPRQEMPRRKWTKTILHSWPDLYEFTAQQIINHQFF